MNFFSQVLTENDAASAGCGISVVNESLSVYLKLRGILNAEAECEKLQKKYRGNTKVSAFSLLKFQTAVHNLCYSFNDARTSSNAAAN